MNLSNHTFIALDLETTGLDTKKDTIIEVAAVRFHLSRNKNGTFETIIDDERSMLVNPGRKLEENISLITGITDAMLEGKSAWEDIREKVMEFIGNESIIVGHNVLFDVAVLQSHNIDLSNHTILDTFELSEILSQEAESLNLGFLSKHYNFNIASEHRALDDTKLSIVLFGHYLGLLSKIDIPQSAIWHEAMTHDPLGMIAILIELSGIISSPFSFDLDWREEEIRENNKIGNTNTLEIRNLSGSREEELTLIENEVKKGPLLILVNNRRQSEWMYSLLTKEGYCSEEYFEAKRFCSIEMIQAWLKKEFWTRKETILMIKILTWLGETNTGLLDELKFYGEEREYIDTFRSRENEWNIFREEKRKKIDQSKIVIAEMGIAELSEKNILRDKHTLMIRDCVLFGDILRKKESHHISFEKIHSLSSLLRKKYDGNCWQNINFSIALIREIYETTPVRPQGNSAFPPGDFGETYFFTQENLWNNGNKWLVLASYSLQNSIVDITALLKDAEIIDKKYSEELLWNIGNLVELAQRYDGNTGIILQISESDTVVISVPRSIKNSIEKVINIQGNGKIIFSGYGISGEKVRKFIKNEYNINLPIDGEGEESTIHIQNRITVKEKKTVILSTNMKHLRQITQEIKGSQGIKNIWTQGLSGGKGKILSLFQNSSEKSVLIGLLDSYTDESFLWERVDEVIIAKMPFDPPTDPYFLARTVGMKNNFEEYSAPLSIAKINTLIGRIRNANPHAKIYCLDDRLEKMLWGKEFKKELL